MAKTCASCGAVSESGQGYQSTAILRRKDWCPICFPKAKSREGWFTLAALPTGMIISWLMTHSRPPNNQMGWFGLNVIIALGFWAVIVLPHELGHALIARAVGWRVFKLVVGYGPLLYKRSFLDGTLEIHAHPWGGYTIPTAPDVKHFRLRKMITTAAGPLFNGLLILAVLPWMSLPNPFAGFLSSWNPLGGFVLANLWALILSLFPWRFSTTIGVQESDGLAILRSPFMTDDQVRTGAAVHFLVQGHSSLEVKDFAAAAGWYEEGLKLYPESLPLRNDFGVLLIRRREYERARKELSPILTQDQVEPSVKGLVYNNIAYCDLLLDRPDLVDEALRYSEEAMKLVGWNPPVRGTRATALVLGGRVDEGMALAKEMIDRNTEPERKSFNALALALGYKARGNVAEGRTFVEMAEKLDPECLFLPRVRREFSGVAQ